MSLGVVFRGPEGVVLAADSRVTLTATLPTGQIIPASFDNATKLLKVKGQEYVAAVTYGLGALGANNEPRTAHSFLPEFESELGKQRLSVLDFATKLGEFYKQQWDASGPMPVGTDPLLFLVGGFDEGATYGRVFEVGVPHALTPTERPDFGIAWGGQTEVATRLLNGYDPTLFDLVQQHLSLDAATLDSLKAQVCPQLGMPIPYPFLPLQDCVDLAILLISVTSRLQDFYVGVRGVGGAIDVATITRTDGFCEIQQKKVGGERT